MTAVARWLRAGPSPRAGLLLGSLLLGMLATSLSGLVWASRPAHGQAGPADAVVTITSLAPEVPRPGGRLRIIGQVRNPTSTTLAEVSVRLRISAQRVASRGQLDDVSRGRDVSDATVVTGTTRELGDIEPRSSMPFALASEVDALGLGDFGVYPLSVEARGMPDGDRRHRLGSVHTFLSWAPEPMRAQLTSVTWLWPLAARPRREVDGTFLDDHLAAELAAGGRLGRLLRIGGVRGVTWVVDPMLLDDARAMTAGYSVRAATSAGASARPTTRPGRSTTGARTFLDDLREATANADVVALPYGDVDLTAATRNGLGGLVRAGFARGSATAAQVLGRPLRPAVTVPPGGWLDRRTAEVLWSAGVRRVVLADGARAPQGVSFTPTGRAIVPVGRGRTLDAVLVDGRLSALAAAAAAGTESSALVRARFLAETAMIAAERPSVPRTVAIAPPARWAPDPEAAERLLQLTGSRVAPWLRTVSLEDAFDEPVPDVLRAPLSYPSDALSEELPAGYLAEVRRIGTAARTMAEAVVPPATVRARYELAQLRLASAGLRDDTDLRGRLLESTRLHLAGLVHGVRVLPTSVQLPSRNGTFPVTVANDLDQPVTVRLSLTTNSPRLSVDATTTVSIGAGRKEQVLVPARAVANGLATVDAQLSTPSGEPFGDPVEIRVRVTPYGGAALLVTACAAVLLFVAAGRNLFLRIQRSRRGQSAAAPVGDEEPAAYAGVVPPTEEAASEPPGVVADTPAGKPAQPVPGSNREQRAP